MNGNTDFDRIAQSWLQDGPTAMPDRSLQAALDEVHVTSQRRFGAARRTFDMNGNTSRFAIAAVIGLLILIGGGIYLGNNGSGGPGGAPAPTPTPSPNPATLVSYRAARNAICERVAVVVHGADSQSGLNAQLQGLYDPTLSDTERAPKIAALTSIRDAGAQQLAQLEGLAVPAVPATLAADHAANLADYAENQRLLTQVLVKLADRQLSAAETLDKATDTYSRRIETFETTYVLSGCA